MKYRKLVALPAALICGLLLFSACSRISADEALVKLQKGMTVEEVKDAIGSPSRSEDLGENKKLYIYKADKGYIVVFLVDGKVKNFNRTDRIIHR